MRPIEEARARSAALREQFKNDPGSQGAYVRLVRHLDPNAICAWLREEVDRGTAKDDMLIAISRVLALQFLVTSGIMPRSPAENIDAMKVLVAMSLEAMLSGELRVSGVVVDSKTGEETEITGEGMGSETFNPFPKKG